MYHITTLTALGKQPEPGAADVQDLDVLLLCEL